MNICKQCGKETTNKKFCNTSCAAKYNNAHRTFKPREDKRTKESICPKCGNPFLANIRATVNETRCSKCRVVKQRFCINCNNPLVNSQKKYCSPHCDLEYRYKKYIQEWKSGNRDGITGKYGTSDYIRRYLRERSNNNCEKCGWNKVNPKTNKIPLHINHIDGDCLNNKEENLEYICPNCHSLTENYGSLNSNSVRYNHMKKHYQGN